jgi:hypothetical protein
MKRIALRLIATGGLMVAVLAPAAAANAVYGGGPAGGQGPPVTGQGAPGGPGTSGTLPFTGSDVFELGLIGVGLSAGGFALARSSRRRVDTA